VKAETIYTNEAATTSADSTTAAKVVTEAGTATKDSPAQSEDDASKIATLFSDATTVTYTGTGALTTTALEVPTGKALIITKAAAAPTTGTVTVNGTLEIIAGASIDLGTAGTITDYTKVQNNGIIATATTSGDTLKKVLKAKGQIVLNGNVSVDASTEINEGTELVIAGSKKLTVAEDLTIPSGAGLAVAEGATLEVSAGKTLTIAGNIGGSGTITNNATGTIAIAVADEVPLRFILGKVSTGTVEVGENITIGTTTVASGVTLKIAENTTLTVTGTLTVSNAITGEAGAKIVVGTNGELSAPTNFYYSNGTTTLGHPITVGTYTWGDNKWTGLQTAPATVRNTSIASEVEWETDPNIVTINYGGTDPLAGDETFAVPDGKTLIITGSITNQAKKITKGTDSTVTNNGTINTATSGITADILTNLVSFGGSGTIKLAMGVSLTETLELSQNLEIDTSVTLALGTNPISNYSKVTNGGIITTATTSVATLNGILAANGNITATAIAPGSSDPTLTVPANTALTVSNLTVGSGNTLTLSLTGTISGTIINDGGTIDLGSLSSISPATISNTSGTIQTADATMLATLLGSSGVTAGKVELTGAVNLTSTLALSTDLEIGDNGSLSTTATTAFSNSKNVTIGTAGKLDLGSAITTLGATITNNGTSADAVKTSTTDGSVLSTILTAVKGNITLAGDVDVAASTTLQGGTTLTIASGTTLTVPDTVTLTIGADGEGGAATLTLAAGVTPGKLVLTEGGKVNAANNDSTIVSGETPAESNVTVSAVNGSNAATKVSDTDTTAEDTVWVLTATSEDATSVDVILGKFKLATGTVELTNIPGTTESGSPASGTLTAGVGTTITFAGEEDVG
jgi:hypothetical protein